MGIETKPEDQGAQRMPTVDIHSHFFPQVSREQAAELDPTTAPWLHVAQDGRATIMVGEKPFRPVTRSLWDPLARLEDMDLHGIDVQIACATPVMFGYGYELKRVLPWTRRMNDLALDMCACSPWRLKALAQVPLQDIDAACREASRAKSNGHVGVQIGNHVGDRDLDDDGLVTFLSHCANESIPVLVHPWDMMGGDRMRKWMLPWLVAMPAETQLGILSLILSGAFERLPACLRICFAHGGGSFAFLLGRVDNAWRNREIVRQDCPQLPSSYTNRFYVDSAVFDQRALRLLVEVMGDERIMLGSDYPFPLGEEQVGDLIRSTDLPRRTQRNLLGANAQACFAISA